MSPRMAGQLDTIIVGQGLAGTTLAWHLIEAGQSVLVIDPGDAVTSSRIAAGLITPITGKQMALSASYKAERALAEAFYRHIQQRLGRPIYHERIAVRVLTDEAERCKWETRRGLSEYEQVLVPQPEGMPDNAFAMRAGQVDTRAYIEASARTLPMLRARLDWHRDVAFEADGVTALGHRARQIVSCEGHAATRNPYFDWVPFRAAKGEILTLRLGVRWPAQTTHCGIWLAPTEKPDAFKLGATFSWDVLDQTPTEAGRAELEAKLKAIYRGPYSVIAHQAAVRPIINANRACMGRHPHQPQLLFFNGLASKGALRAPRAARRLAEHMARGAPLQEDEDVAVFAHLCRA